MKTKILKLSTVFSLLLCVSASCNKDNDYEDPKITYDFKLLNESKESDTIFIENEIFYFHFSIKSNDTEWKFSRFMYNDSNFLRVYRIEEDKRINVGVPFKSYWCQAIQYECGHNTPYIFEIPWMTGIGENEIPDQDIYPPFCMFYNTNNLPKGKYVTYFDESLEFIRCGKELEAGVFDKEFYITELNHFEILFEIK